MNKNIMKAGLIGLIVAVMYIPTFMWMWERWFAEESYYSHGILIPIVSFFLFLFKKEELQKVKVEKNKLGILLIAFSLMLHMVSAFERTYFTSGVSLIFLIMGLVLYFLGTAYLTKVLYPILFLFFMVPMPLVFIANLSVKLKLFATFCATKALNKVGIRAVQDGSTIRTVNSLMLVEGPCSGIRSLISLLALGALVAYFMKANWLKKTFLIALTIPIAVSANIFRIVLLTSVSEIYGEKFAMGWFHDFSGFLLFAVALIGLMVAKQVVE